MIDRILQAYARSNYDFRTTAKPGDTLAHLFEQWVPYYRMKAAVAEALQPKTVLEVGVRYGYGGAAFLHGSPQAHYTGIDLDADTFGGEKGAIGWARQIMPAGQCDLVVADSQKLTRFPGGIYDLVHVDGQQNESGTFHDLLLAIRQARYILVDGYFWTAENFHAANDFLNRFREDIEYALVIPGYAGEMLIKVKSTALTGADASKPVDSTAIRDLYTEKYFLRDCGGWEFFAATRDRLVHDGRLRSMADLMFLQPVRRVLDLGAGRGELTVLAALAGCEVTAVDYSQDAVNILRKSLETHPEAARRVKCVCANVCEFTPEGRYDAVLAGDVVEHLNPAELDELYRRVAGALAPNGRFIVHTFPNRWFYDYAHVWRRAEARKLGAHLPANPRSRFELLMHINEQSPRGLRRQLRSHFPHVQLWFGSPDDPGGSLLRHCRPRELAAYRDLYAIASPVPVDVAPIRQAFRSEALADRSFTVELIEAPAEVAAGTAFTCLVRVKNLSSTSYLASRPPYPTYLSYQWHHATGESLGGEGWRSTLTPALAPQSTHSYSMRVLAPAVRGELKLTLSLVQEHQFWLCHARPDLCPQQVMQVT